MFKMVNEGKVDVFLTAPTQDTNAGTLVKLGTSGNVVACNPGDKPYGVLAQDVRDRRVNNFKLDSITHLAFYGEKVGVYFDSGLYMTDNTASAITVGGYLYVGANGQFTATAPTSGNFTGPVAISEQAGTAGTKIRIRLLSEI
jgi:hypothetical protein